MRHSHSSTPAAQGSRLAAVFVDYDNLYELLAGRLDGRGYPDEIIIELLEELRQHLLDTSDTQVALTLAYGDFSAYGDNGAYIQRSLYLQEAETRFVPVALQANAAELQLCIEAVDLLNTRPDVDTFVVLTGDRAYLPLVQQTRRHGRETLVATFDRSNANEHVGYRDSFFEVASLLSEPSRAQLQASAPRAEVPHLEAEDEVLEAPARPQPTFVGIEDPVLLRTIEIIEEHFGQYDEVYLTPLLRKLSELLDEREYDPKALISDLETHGAARLEKRRGFPYDYTVLIVEPEHPDVARIREAFAERPDAADDDLEDYDAFDEPADLDAVAESSGDGSMASSGYDDSDWDEDVR